MVVRAPSPVWHAGGRTSRVREESTILPRTSQGGNERPSARCPLVIEAALPHGSRRPTIVKLEGPTPASTTPFSEAVRDGLMARPKSLPWQYFYDEVGSRLFERICHLPEYYLTRTE